MRVQFHAALFMVDITSADGRQLAEYLDHSEEPPTRPFPLPVTAWCTPVPDVAGALESVYRDDEWVYGRGYADSSTPAGAGLVRRLISLRRVYGGAEFADAEFSPGLTLHEVDSGKTVVFTRWRLAGFAAYLDGKQGAFPGAKMWLDPSAHRWWMGTGLHLLVTGWLWLREKLELPAFRVSGKRRR